MAPPKAKGAKKADGEEREEAQAQAQQEGTSGEEGEEQSSKGPSLHDAALVQRLLEAQEELLPGILAEVLGVADSFEKEVRHSVLVDLYFLVLRFARVQGFSTPQALRLVDVAHSLLGTAVSTDPVENEEQQVVRGALRDMLLQVNAADTVQFLQSCAFPVEGALEQAERERQRRLEELEEKQQQQKRAQEEATEAGAKQPAGKRGGKAAPPARGGKGPSKEEEEEAAEREAAEKARRRALEWDPARHRFSREDLLRVADFFHDELVQHAHLYHAVMLLEQQREVCEVHKFVETPLAPPPLAESMTQEQFEEEHARRQEEKAQKEQQELEEREQREREEEEERQRVEKEEAEKLALEMENKYSDEVRGILQEVKGEFESEKEQLLGRIAQLESSLGLPEGGSAAEEPAGKRRVSRSPSPTGKRGGKAAARAKR